MHILVLPSWYPTPEDPIRGCFFREQAEALASFGHRVSVFAFYSDNERGVRTEKRVNGCLSEFLIHVKPIRFHLTYFVVLKEMLRLLREELKGDWPDVIHVHSFYAMRYARGLCFLRRTPIVITEHVTWFERKILSPRELKRIRRDYCAADSVIAVSPGLQEQIQPYCTNKDVHVIPNMVSASFLQGEIHSLPNSTMGFVSVGGLAKKKGFDLLLSAFAEVHEKHPDYRLTICGGGTEEENLRSQAMRLKLTDSVVFTGQVSREECAQHLRENQIFVLPSRAETFGVVFVEAMACGLPIIMTKLGAWTMLAKPETGVAIEPENVQELTEAMLYVAEHYSAYDAGKIREFCEIHFSGNSVCKQLTAEYERVLQKRLEDN